MKQTRKQKGVSPIVGTILLIAITVALAAVVASLVLHFGGPTGRPSPAPSTPSVPEYWYAVVVEDENGSPVDNVSVIYTPEFGLGWLEGGTTDSFGRVIFNSVGENGVLAVAFMEDVLPRGSIPMGFAWIMPIYTIPDISHSMSRYELRRLLEWGMRWDNAPRIIWGSIENGVWVNIAGIWLPEKGGEKDGE